MPAEGGDCGRFTSKLSQRSALLQSVALRWSKAAATCKHDAAPSVFFFCFTKVRAFGLEGLSRSLDLNKPSLLVLEAATN